MKVCISFSLLLIVLIAVPFQNLNAAILVIDQSGSGDFVAIQDGIDAANNGDTVLVTDGTYTGLRNKNLDFKGKGITVRSENGPQVTIIDCQNSGRGFYFHEGTGEQAVVSGFTITNGKTDDGGGIFCEGPSPVITNCVFINNQADYGGGIHCDYGATPNISNCTFLENSAVEYGGGLLTMWGSAPTITNCSFRKNTAGGGGGIAVGYQSDPQITNCTFIENQALDKNEGAGAIGIQYDSNVVVKNCLFEKNLSSGDGGAIGIRYHNSLSITDCTFSENVSIYEGGAVYNMQSHLSVSTSRFYNNTGRGGGGIYHNGTDKTKLLSITTSIFAENSALGGGGLEIYMQSAAKITSSLFRGNIASAWEGGAIRCHVNSTAIITNCTLANNSADDEGGGVYISYATVDVENNILWGNTPDQLYDSQYKTDVSVKFSNIQNSYAGEANINETPEFAGLNNYHLKPGSPCIGTGNNSATEIPKTDLDGKLRIIGQKVDMGAYELSSNTTHITLLLLSH